MQLKFVTKPLKLYLVSGPLTPISSSINSVTYNIAKHSVTILTLLVGHTDHHIQNSEEFASRVKGLKLDTYETLLSFNVSSLFTNISTTDALTVIRKRLEDNST